MRLRAETILLLALSVAAWPATLAQNIDQFLATAPAARSSFWGIQVVDLRSGKVLYQKNHDHLFVPASNTKLFTTALALSRLGPDFTFQTHVVAALAPDADGRIAGDVRLVGGGDPNLSGRTIPYQPGAAAGPVCRSAGCRGRLQTHRRRRRGARARRAPRDRSGHSGGPRSRRRAVSKHFLTKPRRAGTRILAIALLYLHDLK